MLHHPFKHWASLFLVTCLLRMTDWLDKPSLWQNRHWQEAGSCTAGAPGQNSTLSPLAASLIQVQQRGVQFAHAQMGSKNRWVWLNGAALTNREQTQIIYHRVIVLSCSDGAARRHLSLKYVLVNYTKTEPCTVILCCCKDNSLYIKVLPAWLSKNVQPFTVSLCKWLTTAAVLQGRQRSKCHAGRDLSSAFPHLL